MDMMSRVFSPYDLNFSAWNPLRNILTKVVNFEPWIMEGGELIQPLQDIKYFKKVKMDKFNYTISWPNGADFCPDVLYESGEEVGVSQKRACGISKGPVKSIKRRKQTRVAADSKN